MNPWATSILLVGGFAGFSWSILRKLRLLQVGGVAGRHWSNPGARLTRVWRRVLLHDKLYGYRLSGFAHHLVFFGFVVLLLRSFILWGRGFDCRFGSWFLAPDSTAGVVYHCLKDACVLGVLVGIGIFLFQRLVRRQRRLTLNAEGLAIPFLIGLMMFADVLYDTAGIALRHALESGCRNDYCAAAQNMLIPFAELDAARLPRFVPAVWLSGAFARVTVPALVVLGHIGFWSHVVLVLVLLNLLPYSKHLHIVTAIPNVLFANQSSQSHLRLLAPNSESLLALVERTTELDDELRAPIGAARITHFSWKDLLDLYACTECGRCSDRCPATQSGKALDPKRLILGLRTHLNQQQPAARDLRFERQAVEAWLASPSSPLDQATARPHPGSLVPDVVAPDALWACTTCRACEQECPVDIAHVAKINELRRNLVLVRGEHFPAELQRVFDGLETNGNPWNFPRAERSAWALDLNLKTMAEKPSAEVLLWVGCSASYDPLNRGIARATARLLTLAKVDFAILGNEESCTGDPARRAGHEHLFLTAAERNIATIERYRRQGGIQRIVTACPHCYNALANDYATLGVTYDVVHHSQLLLELVQSGRLTPRASPSGSAVFQDSCYLGRYNGVYDAPRQLLATCGVPVLEVSGHSRSRGGCCGAGGARVWLEEPEHQRVNAARMAALLGTGVQRIATSCPFCKTMLSDASAPQRNRPTQIRDIAEILWEACR